MPGGEEEGGSGSGTDSEIRRASVVSFPFFIVSLLEGKLLSFWKYFFFISPRAWFWLAG